MNDTGMVVGRLSLDVIKRIIVKHPDEDIRHEFMRYLEVFPKYPDAHDIKDLVISQPIQVIP
jgi:hypothetical protein